MVQLKSVGDRKKFKFSETGVTYRMVRKELDKKQVIVSSIRSGKSYRKDINKNGKPVLVHAIV